MASVDQKRSCSRLSRFEAGGCGHGLFSFLPGFLRHFALFGGEKTIYGGKKYLNPVTIAENRNDGAIGLDAVNIHVS